MIVKDESQVIKRSLKSVKPFIDYWVIVDTGSKDGTQQLICEYLKDIPGELYEQPWVNFGHNRNEALKLAKGKGDYVLFIDADEVLEGTFSKNDLSHDVYLITLRTSSAPLTTCQRAFLINNHLDWSWKGVLHESLQCEQETKLEFAQNVAISAEATDGNRSRDPGKFLKDAKMLELALLDDPTNAEYVYYTAQSYYNAKELPQALKWFQKRAAMVGWDEQTFWAKYYVAHVQELLNQDPERIIQNYCDAYHFRPTRAEPIARLAQCYYEQKKYILAYALAKFGLSIPTPKDIIYIEDWIYSYGMEAVYANCALALGRYEEALKAYQKLAQNNDLPDPMRQEAIATIRFLREKD